MKRTVVAVLFVATFVALTPVSLRVADGFTHSPVGLLEGYPFPVLVVDGRHATVQMVERVEDFRSTGLRGGRLVPPDSEAAILADIRRQDEPLSLDATWTLKVERLSPTRQRIYLVRTGDGMWGGVYEATANGVTPLYRKATGPGFAFVFGSVAFALTVLCWACVWLLWRRYTRPA